MEPPKSVRKIIEAMVANAVAKCQQTGIDLADFYAAMLQEQKASPKADVAELFDLTWKRLESRRN